uniref:Uncharacterized protein n=1 Tax=uncultured marine virus TaxID=186617 RepID=A0A0F7L6M3_9VIRU|nr:hypothetical protein [uncultured marine virus]
MGHSSSRSLVSPSTKRDPDARLTEHTASGDVRLGATRPGLVSCSLDVLVGLRCPAQPDAATTNDPDVPRPIVKLAPRVGSRLRPEQSRTTGSACGLHASISCSSIHPIRVMDQTRICFVGEPFRLSSLTTHTFVNVPNMGRLFLWSSHLRLRVATPAGVVTCASSHPSAGCHPARSTNPHRSCERVR